MKFYERYSLAKLAIAGLSLVYLMIMSAPAAYAHNSVQQTKSSSYKFGIAKTDNYAPAIASRIANNALARKEQVSAHHEKYDLADRPDDNEDHCRHHFCENIFVVIVSTSNNKPEDKYIALSAHTDAVSVKPIIIVIHSGFVTSLTPSPLQGTLRFRVLLI
jgi:hypothetical protein